jgi:hypothetical protein
MHITRRALMKWSLVVAICGGQSFYFGMLVLQEYSQRRLTACLAMACGMVGLILLFAVVESGRWYQAKRIVLPRAARAAELGIQIRCGLAVLFIVFCYQYPLTLGRIPDIDLLIGALALDCTQSLTGLSMISVPGEPVYYFLKVLLITTLTIAFQLCLLGLLCGMIYGILRLRSRLAR